MAPERTRFRLVGHHASSRRTVSARPQGRVRRPRTTRSAWHRTTGHAELSSLDTVGQLPMALLDRAWDSQPGTGRPARRPVTDKLSHRAGRLCMSRAGWTWNGYTDRDRWLMTRRRGLSRGADLMDVNAKTRRAGGGAPLANQMHTASGSLTRTWLREWDRLSTRQDDPEARPWNAGIALDWRSLAERGSLGGVRLA